MIITLTTDFGADSGYAGQMKGVLVTRAPEARLIDLSHSILPFDVTAAALLLEDSIGAFPDGTTHLVVVDPGVGTSRRPLALAWRGHRLVGPDNGVFEPFLDEAAVHVIERRDIFRRPVSEVFHGRDLFAPAAAFLARGGLPAELGRPVVDMVRLSWPVIERQSRWIRAPVLRADAFGNLLTRLRRSDLPADANAEVSLVPASDERTAVPLRRTYGDVPAGNLVALWGSNDRLEIAMCRGSASAYLGFPTSALWVEVTWT